MKNNELSWRISLILTIVLYIITNSLFLILNDVWWDDYTVWNVTSDSLYAYLGPGDANEVAQYAYIKAVTSLFSPQMQIMVFHLVSLAIHVLSLIAVWYIVKRLSENVYFTSFTLLLVASFGLDKTQFLIINSHATFANCLFLAGLALFVKDYYGHKKLTIWLISVIWFCSLFIWRTPALLIPFSIIVSSCKSANFSIRERKTYWQSVKHCLTYYWPVILSCVAFLLVYKIFLAQDGLHATYYVPTLSKALFAPVLSVCSGVMALLYYASSSLNSLTLYDSLPYFAFTFFSFAVVYYIVRKCWGATSCKISTTTCAFAYLCLTLLLPLSIYGDYQLAGFEEYNTRVFCLAALPISIIAVSFLCKLGNRLFIVCYSLLLTGSIFYSIYTQVDYGFSLIKRDFIVEYLRDNSELENSRILIRDASFSTNANRALIRNYEYEGMARMAYGKETNTMVMSYYGRNQHTFDPNYIIEISQNKYPISYSYKVKRLLYFMIHRDQNLRRDYYMTLFDIKLKPISVNSRF